MKAILALAVGLTTLAASAQRQVGSTGPAGAIEQSSAPSPQTGMFFVPDSSKEKPGSFHTNYVLRSKDGTKPGPASSFADEFLVNPDSTISEAETPCSLGTLYVHSPATACKPSFSATGGPSSAGYGAIAIVDAYDNPDAASDLAQFSSHFGLAAATFTKVYANGNGDCKTPPTNTGWALEESLDIEWAHVFAPKAAIVLVEACSSSYNDLFYAEGVAFNYIVAHYPAGGQVSNSWSGGEFSGQIADDVKFADFTYNGATGYVTPILAFASAGDSGLGAGYPSTNPWVISAGGTTINRNSTTGAFSSESCWNGSGGGISAQETWANSYTGGNMGPWASYQYPIFGPAARATPDLSFDADPDSGVYVLSQANGGWYIVGGTSVSSPALASIVNRSGNKLGSVNIHPIEGGGYFTASEHNLLYSQLYAETAYPVNFYDVTTGSNGASALKGYDLCTGVGSPRLLLGK